MDRWLDNWEDVDKETKRWVVNVRIWKDGTSWEAGRPALEFAPFTLFINPSHNIIRLLFNCLDQERTAKAKILLLWKFIFIMWLPFVAGTRPPFGWNPLWHQVGLLPPEYAAGWAHCPAKYVSQCHLHNLTYKLARMECHITATQIWPIHRWFNTLAVDEISSRVEGRRLEWLELNGKPLDCVVAHIFH